MLQSVFQVFFGFVATPGCSLEYSWHKPLLA